MEQQLDRRPLPTVEQWEAFMKDPCWLYIVEELEEAEKLINNLLGSNTLLKAQSRDNFPEVKYERGRLASVKTFMNLPYAKQVFAQEEKNGQRRRSEQTDSGFAEV